jgi:hypothetical protein
MTDDVLRLWSVTTLIKLGLGTSDALVGWVAKTIAEAAINSRATVSQMLADEGEEAAITWLKDARWRQTKKAQIRGSELHAAAEQLALGARPIVDATVLPYVEQYARWLRTWAPRFVMAEAPVYNPSYLYAGTLDGIVKIEERTVLFDIKTTPYGPNEDRSRPPYPEVALQLAAYARATHVGVLSEQRYDDRRRRYYIFDPKAQHEPMPKIDRALCIVVSPYDCFAVPVRIDDSVWNAFLYVREAARWQLAGAHNLFGPPIVAEKDAAA